LKKADVAIRRGVSIVWGVWMTRKWTFCSCEEDARVSTPSKLRSQDDHIDA
jgi:hypothetical protein